MSKEESAQAFVNAIAPHIRDVWAQGHAAGVASMHFVSQDRERINQAIAEVIKGEQNETIRSVIGQMIGIVLADLGFYPPTKIETPVLQTVDSRPGHISFLIADHVEQAVIGS